MDEANYYYVYYCLHTLFVRKRITRNVANKILKEYEETCNPKQKKSF